MTLRSNSLRRARPLLGTLVEICVPEGTVAQAVHDAFASIERAHRLMSAQERASDVSRINCAPTGMDVSIDVWTDRVLRRAQEIFLATDGVFDCCAGAGAWKDLELMPGLAVRKRRPLQITLDGIAKGFAVDQAVAALRDAGIKAGVVNAGGDLRIFGELPEDVYVRDPSDISRLILLGPIQNEAVATSASYFSGMSKIVHPRTGHRCCPDSSVTVVAPDCMTADALTKALILEPARAGSAKARFGARSYILPAPSGSI
jgi:thiamine biosynthesis lipoprotein